MKVIRNRMTNCAFVAGHEVPREHFEMILEGARARPVWAECQRWHFIVVTESAVKDPSARCFVEEQQHHMELHIGFPTLQL
jgi:nitroreductase